MLLFFADHRRRLFCTSSVKRATVETKRKYLVCVLLWTSRKGTAISNAYYIELPTTANSLLYQELSLFIDHPAANNINTK